MLSKMARRLSSLSMEAVIARSASDVAICLCYKEFLESGYIV